MALLRGWPAVLLGRKTWVGYAPSPQNVTLPRLRPGVFSPLDTAQLQQPNEQTVARLNFLYAKDWTLWRDVEAVWS